MQVTHISGRVRLNSSLPLESLGEILSSKVFSGMKFGGKEQRIYDEVPAIYIKHGVLGFSVVLFDNSGHGSDYIIELITMHIVDGNEGAAVNIDLYLASFFKKALLDVKEIMLV